jgi:hypothetical protein
MEAAQALAGGAIGQALSRAAVATGVDFGQLLETARRESSFDPSARAQTSSAAGLFQFVEQTWLATVARYGARHGLAADAASIDMSSGRPRVADPEARRQILAKRFDPEISARLAGELTRENAAALEKAFGRTPSAGEIYAAHVLGAGGAVRLARAAGDGAPDAAALFPREAAANRALFFEREGAARSPAAMLARFERMMGGAAAIPAPSSSPANAPPEPAIALADVEAMRQAMVAAALRALFDLAGGDRDGARLMGLGAYSRALRP